MSTSIFGRRAAAHALGLLFIGGSAVGLITLLLPHDPMVNDGPLYGLAAVAIAIGLLLLARADRVSHAELHAIVALGTLLVAVGNLPVGTTTLYPMIYTWMVLYAFTFFERRAALAHLALAGVSYAVVLVLQDDPSSPVARWVLVVATPLVGGLLVSRVLELARERTRVLQDSERRTRAIVQGAPDAFVSMDVEGAVVAWNRAAERMFFIPEVEALGRQGAELMFAPEDRDAHCKRLLDQLERPEGEAGAVRRRLELVRRDGSSFPAEAVINRVTAEGRSLLVAFIRDVSNEAQQERERAQLIRAQAAREEAEQMAAIVQGLQVLLDAAFTHVRVEDMLGALLPRLCEVLSADAAAVFLLDDEERVLTLRASTAGLDPAAPPPRVTLGEGLAGRVAARGEPELLQSPTDDEVVDPGLRNADSVLCVPLLARGKVTGVVKVGVQGRELSEDDLAILGLAADRVGLALDRARLFEREHHIAETLQRSLLPDRLPAVPGLDVAVEYLPAAAEAEVGGDWYDVIPVESGRVGVVMGDVAGKGLAAASLVGRLRSAIRAYALEGHDPQTVVERLNRVMWSEIEETEMATLVYVVLDPTAGTISWVNAGHLPPLLLDGDGEHRFLYGARAVPVGVMPNAVYEARESELPPGAGLLLYTDGLVERPGEAIDDGLERLCEAALEADGDVERLCQDLLARLVPGGAAADDVALLAMRTPPLGDRFVLDLASESSRLAGMRVLLRRWLRHVGGTEEEVMEVLTAAGEAAANAIEHAHAGSKLPLEVAGRLSDGEVELVVHDHGRWVQRGASNGERGRGLALMRALMDKVEVTPSPDGTTVRMRRRLGAVRTAPVGPAHGRPA